MPEISSLSVPHTDTPEHRQYSFEASPTASEHTCEKCKVRDAEMSFSYWSPEDEYDESGFCCTLCAMAMVSELSKIERAVKIETSDGRWCQIYMGDEDNHSVSLGSR